ncbi:galactose-1-phosphate uridylyltransferase [Candidatus Woesearchaeota archaeon]|nr:MAG: galactose-1-phosphate uridylyltransferase [Candidatus Woesearchaeota archaeon]
MAELRKDYFLDRWVLIAPKRGKRPHEIEQKELHHEGVCSFCPGNESMTPREIGRIPQNGGWAVRWFPNPFAALVPEGNAAPRTDNRFFTFAGGFGHQEVIAETPRHDKQLADLSEGEIAQVLEVYARRIVELEKKERIAYVSVFKNHGFQAGTSIVHSHSQVWAMGVIPRDVQEKLRASAKFLRCPYCAVIDVESVGARRCFENADFIAFTPYASRFNYEVWVLPRQHVSRFEQLNVKSLAAILKKVLVRVGNLDYNLTVTYAPKGRDLHVHLELLPRVALWGGFELGTGVIVNAVSPEDAARFYRGEL